MSQVQCTILDAIGLATYGDCDIEHRYLYDAVTLTLGHFRKRLIVLVDPLAPTPSWPSFGQRQLVPQPRVTILSSWWTDQGLWLKLVGLWS